MNLGKDDVWISFISWFLLLFLTFLIYKSLNLSPYLHTKSNMLFYFNIPIDILRNWFRFGQFIFTKIYEPFKHLTNGLEVCQQVQACIGFLIITIANGMTGIKMTVLSVFLQLGDKTEE